MGDTIMVLIQKVKKKPPSMGSLYTPAHIIP